MTGHPILKLKWWWRFHGPPGEALLLVLVGVLVVAVLWSVIEESERHSANCEAAGGVYMSRQHVCLRRDLTLPVPP